MDDALHRLLERRSEFLAYLRKQGATADQAEDLVQSALERSLEPWTAAPSPESVVPWFHRVLRNALIDQARRRAVRDRALERYAHEVPDAEMPKVARRVCACTRKVLALLKPEYRELVQAVDVNGEAVEAAAARLGVTANNAHVRLHRARRALRDRLQAQCGSCATSEGGCGDCYCQPDEPV